MEIIGERIFAKDAEGQLVSRIGTMFFRTPGLVTKKGAHAMQRMLWIDELNARRERQGLAPLSETEEEEELALSCDLIFTDDTVLIRPDPDRMDLAFRADDELQLMVPKRQIRYLNTSSAKVRQALCERGENWRMARHPISQDDISDLIRRSLVSVEEQPVYFYNRATGTRYITAGAYQRLTTLSDEAYVRQVAEVVKGLNSRNRLGQPEVDIFPITTPPEIKRALRELKLDALSVPELRRAVEHIVTEWRMTIPPELREETCANFDWRNEMCHAITRQPNETAAEEQELVSGIASEFYRQIEWLPGARIDRGEVIFDELSGEDPRVHSLIFNLTRVFGAIDFINVGRIANSLARRPVEGSRRGNVYFIQYRETGAANFKIIIIRFQKWGVAERLDEGKDMVQAIVESDEYSDYILDRRLMCRQLGMSLPRRIGYGHFTERYHGRNERYNGASVRTSYFVRPYVHGTASDKLPLAKYRNPAFAHEFARLMGAAAAVDAIVGRRSSSTNEVLFDNNYEVIVLGEDGLPSSLVVTDQAGSFVNYQDRIEDYVAAYARVCVRRRAYVADYAGFVETYVRAFVEKFQAVQNAYRERRKAFDGLFRDRPFDTNGSGAYRWSCALSRLESTDVGRLGEILRSTANEK